VGFGFGDAVIEALLDDEGVKPACPRELDAVVFPFGEAERPAAIRVAQRLRAGGRSVELVLAPMKLKRALADADRAGARFIYLLGPEEVARGVALVRDLESGEQSEEPLPTG
jgi:histidyl-tRNA synthetase